MTNPTVNRSLKDQAMDDIDHALGRPDDPLSESYRNYYALDGNSVLAAAMRASPYWVTGRNIPGQLQCFYVTQAGREALAAHLKDVGEES